MENKDFSFVWRWLKKLKMELPHDLAVPLLGICIKKKGNLFPFLPPSASHTRTWGLQLAHCLTVPVCCGLMEGLQIAPRKSQFVFSSRWPTLLNSDMWVRLHFIQLMLSISPRGANARCKPKVPPWSLRHIGKIPLQSQERIQLMFSACVVFME